MDKPAEYGKALKLIRRRRKYLFSVILLYVPAMWLIHSVSPAISTMLTAFVIWVAMLMTTCMMAAVCKCPRCGNYFHVHGMTMLFLRKCLHCQLHINADRTT
jgi:heme A synthase